MAIMDGPFRLHGSQVHLRFITVRPHLVDFVSVLQLIVFSRTVVGSGSEKRIDAPCSRTASLCDSCAILRHCRAATAFENRLSAGSVTVIPSVSTTVLPASARMRCQR
jgi:hypothetical protein